MSQCDTCSNFVYDEDFEDYMCMVDVDEDDASRQFSDAHFQCPYYSFDNEYAVVRHQAT